LQRIYSHGKRKTEILLAGIKVKNKLEVRMKYKVYGNYVFSKFLGEVEASSQEEAIEKALDDAPENAWLCVQCAGEFEDAGELDENSIVAEEIR
jgi:hypothetical protein